MDFPRIFSSNNFVYTILAGILLNVVLSAGHDIHLKLHKKELTKIFGVEHHSQVPSYSITKPKPIQRDPDEHSIQIDVGNKKLYINLQKNDNIYPHSHFVEHYSVNDDVKRYIGPSGKYSIGKVEGDDDSVVALDHTDGGYTGIIRTADDLYMIHPLPHHLQEDVFPTINSSEAMFDRHNDVIHRKHIVYSTNDVKRDSGQQFSCGTQIEGADYKRSVEDTPHYRQRRSTLVKRSLPEKTLELLIAADYKMVEFYGKEFLPSYMLAIGNIIGGLFRDPSLQYPINIAVTRTLIFEKDIFNASTIQDLLRLWSDWVQKDNPRDDTDPRHYDNAILLTRNGCHAGCSLGGLAYNGMCGAATSQSVSKDNGLMTALTAAHELGHNLDLGHDGTAECPDGTNIMASGAVSGPSAFQWSKCSSQQLYNRLISSSSWCLNDKPPTHFSNNTFQKFGQIYDADKQCQMSLGESHAKCSFFENRCDSLHCRKVGFATCIKSPYPVAHGTYCAPQKWCIHGECVPDGSPAPQPVDGQWGNWGEYLNCSKECGVGAQWRERTCDNPAPAHGGKDCVGSNRGQHKTCNIQDCPPDSEYRNYRTLQCKKYHKDNIDVFDENQPCKLVCGSNSNFFYFGNVEDGTRCNPNFQGNNVCIGGVCKSVGCDLQLESGMIEDRCGVCEGDGGSCVHVNGTDMNAYPNQGQYPIVQVPAHSTNIDIRELGRTMTFMGFKVHGESNLAIRIPSWSSRYNFEDDGGNIVSTVYYDMNDYHYPDAIRAHTIPKGIDVYIVNPYRRPSQGVQWSFYAPRSGNDKKLPLTVYWDHGDWGACSKSCAGGIQTRPLYCKRSDDNSKVSNPVCGSTLSNVTKPADVRDCNKHDCPPEWHISDWTPCSKSCGNGTQSRKIFCAALNYQSAYEEVTGDAATCDPALKPSSPTVQQCSLTTCPAEWAPQAWSKCSTTCGPGRMTRLIVCQRINADGALVIRPELECTHAVDKPNSISTCNDDVLCAEWTTIYSPCSKTCGSGLQIASTVCTIPPSTTPVADSKCDASKKPDPSTLTDKLCNLGTCDIYRWKNISGICSVTCGTGVRPVTTVCVSSMTGVTVDRGLCKSGMDPGNHTVSCNEGVCPVTHNWRTKYTACSQTCGNGTKSMVPYCVRESDGLTVADVMCDASVRPADAVTSCNEGVCPPKYAWKTSYGECSVTCSTGLHKKVFSCVNEVDGKTVDNFLCSHLTKPTIADKACDMGQCPPTYSWKVQYLPCSVTCGTGVEKVNYICVRDGDGEHMDVSLCSGLTKPVATDKVCTLPSCYLWNATYGQCNAECGDGFRVKILTCIERANQTEVADSNCKDLTEPDDVACNLNACVPAFSFNGLSDAYAVGCYKDNPTARRFPRMIGNFRHEINNWFNLTNVIEHCANAANNRVYDFFSLQFFGECWGGPASVANTYYLDGISADCYRGTGRAGVNFVYKFRAPQSLPKLPAIKRLGCYKDDLENPRPVPLLIDNFRDIMDLNNINVDKAVMRCAVAARRRGLTIFALQYYGECWSGDGVKETYARAGDADNCYNGLGATNSFYVYSFV